MSQTLHRQQESNHSMMMTENKEKRYSHDKQQREHENTLSDPE